MSQTTDNAGTGSNAPNDDIPKFMTSLSDVELSALTSTQKGFVMSLRSIDPNMRDDLLRCAVAEMFPPAHLFDKEICDLPAVWVELRNFLNRRGANLTQHSSRRVIMTLAHGLYDDPLDRNAAVEMAQLIVAQGRRVRADLRSQAPQIGPSTPSSTQGGSSGSNVQVMGSRLAHDIAMRFKDSDKKFSGDVGECWMDYVDEYAKVSIDYGLNENQKRQYMHNLLSKDAKRFYLKEVEPHAGTFQQAVDWVNKEYNSIVRQTRVKNYLNSIRVSEFVKDGTEVSAALAKAYKLISRLSRQVPMSHRGDEHKVEFLRNATVGFTWSNEPLSRVATHGLTFQMLYGELEAALQLHKDAKVAIAKDRLLTKPSSHGDQNSIYYAGQARYGKNPRSVRKRFGTSRRIKPLDIAGCFNCGSKDHMVKDCKFPIDTARAATRKLEYYKKKKQEQYAVHMVLAELCHQLDGTNIDEQNLSTGSDVDDVEIFTSLVYAPGEALQITEHERPYNDNEGDTSDDTPSIYVLATSWEMNDEPYQGFEGACVDSGAQRTVIGRPQAVEYCTLLGTQVNDILHMKIVTFLFGKHKHKSEGYIIIRMPIADTCFLTFEAYVLDMDIPLLLGLDVLTKSRLILDFDADKITSKYAHWSFPLTRKYGHIYMEWPVSVLFTESELRKIHRHFYHPHPGKLYAIMRRADPENTSPELMRDLEKITSTCTVCQKEGAAPHRFRVSLPERDCVFNRTVCMDLMKIEKRTVLHIVDKDTKFGAAAFLKGEKALDIWEIFMDIWVTRYIGFPDKIAVDQGPQFVSSEWVQNARLAGIEQQPSGVESHNALGVGERYHSFLRKIYHKIASSSVGLKQEQILQMAVKTLNDTAGPSGLVPTLLVFGVLPRLPINPNNLPSQASRMKAMYEARNEMLKLAHQTRLATALQSNVPSAADKEYSIGDEVLMYREKPRGRWVGPYIVSDKKDKMLTLDTGDGYIRASVDKVKHLQMKTPSPSLDPNMVVEAEQQEKEPAQTTEDVPHESANEPTSDELRYFLDEPIRLEPDHEIGDDLDEDMRDIMKGIQEAERMSNTPAESPSLTHVENAEIFITEVLRPNDPRANSSEFNAAKLSEIEGLKKRKVWKVIARDSVSKDANILGGRFVLSVKDIGTQRQKAKARYVVQGHRDKDKPYMVHDITTLRAASVRMILSIAAIKGFRVYSHDVNQAYVQSKDQMTRKVYILPKARDLDLIGITEDELLELLLPLYGICDAGDYWGVTVQFHVEADLGMKPTLGDPAFYLKVEGDDLIGVMGVYVDDTLIAGNKRFEDVTSETLKRFDSKPRVYDSFDFFGCHISTLNHGKFLLSQRKHAERLPTVPKDCDFNSFRSIRAMANWLVHSRPDLCCALNRASQVTDKTMSYQKVKELNDAIKESRSTSIIGLRFGPLNTCALTIRMYADAAFACNDDLSSQIGYLILLCDNNNKCHILDYSSKKSRRVVRSIMAGETIAFMDGFDRAFIVRRDLEVLLGQRIPLHCFTDSKQIFDAITRGQQTTEKRLMVDILGAREAYKQFEITQIGLVSTHNNPADGLTKVKDNGILHQLIVSCLDLCPVEQWIVRETSSRQSS